jgi:DNA-binding NarL/FixJ family response regulator
VSARRRPALVRSHVITGGRAAPVLSTLDHVTLVTAGTEQDNQRLSPEQRSVVRLCRGGWLSVAEIAAHLALPSSVVKVLVADLVVSGHLSTGAAAAIPRQGPSADLLRQVLEGLHALV